MYKEIFPTINARDYKEPRLIMEVINPEEDGTCRTIKAQYEKTAIANTTYKGSIGATMVSEQLPDDVPQNEKEKIYKVNDGSVSFTGKFGGGGDISNEPT